MMVSRLSYNRGVAQGPIQDLSFDSFCVSVLDLVAGEHFTQSHTRPKHQSKNQSFHSLYTGLTRSVAQAGLAA